jgi:16S rRNA (guanine527-N7)-methyltransferase
MTFHVKQAELEKLGVSPVSRETIDQLGVYEALLKKWQASINLVGPKTLDECWSRHFLDSAQVVPLVPQGVREVYDIGSGAGFPGLVVALLATELRVVLIERDQRKCSFLRTVSRETNAGVSVENSEVGGCDLPAPDLVTARALAPLPELFDLVIPWAQKNPDMVCLFLKGERFEEEIALARNRFEFTVEAIPSFDQVGVVLRVSGLCE